MLEFVKQTVEKYFEEFKSARTLTNSTFEY